MNKQGISFLVILFLLVSIPCYVEAHNKNIKRVPEILKASRPPKIDGDLFDWSMETSITGYQTPDSEETAPSGGNPAPEGEEDFSFEMFAMWDGNNVYFAGEMVDDKAELTNNNNRPWNSEADWIELYMDPLYKGGGSRHIGISFGIINGDEPVAYQSDPNEAICVDYDVALAAVDKLGPNKLPGWVYEARVGKDSWAASGINLQAGQEFGYLTIPGDQDENERKRIAWPPFDAINADNYAGMIFSAKVARSSRAVNPVGKSSITWAFLKSL